MTSIETGPTWSERLNPRNWTLAWKLVIVGLVPALLALALGVLRISDQAGAAAELGQGSRLLDVQSQVGSAADALRQERDAATLFVAGKRIGDRNALDTGFGQTDSVSTGAITGVRGAGELDPAASAALGQASTGIQGLAALRSDVTDSPAVTAVQVRDRYTDIVGRFDRLDSALLNQVSTPDTAALTSALGAVRDATEQLALQHTVLGAGIRATQLQPGDADVVASTSSRLQSDVADYRAALTSGQVAKYGDLLDATADPQRQALATAIVATPPGQPIVQSPADLDAAYTADRTTANRSADLLRQDLAAASSAAEASASNLAGINSVILMLGLLVGITIAVLVARSLIRSLRVLRTAALDVAERRLPQAVESMRAGESPDVTVDPVPLNSRDEVGQVARAFDAVHGQAVRLAADQAALQSNVSAMFVNLSRRSQALVERQLQLIEQLESNEQDADQLSNLFQLDHLATRMRRNSENLLVLAGTDLAKRNIAPVPMVDVLRAAVSEIEQYQRIVVQAPPTAAIVGRAGSDLVHLLAELLDNATNFSPPDSQVVMSTTRTSDGSIVVEIADRGVGMIDHELSDANQRLGGPSSVDVSASRRMGLFVVGRLGARHGIGVRLTTSAAGGPGAGLTASVTVPAYLIPSTEPSESGRPLGIPQPAGAPAQGGRGGEVPQRSNGAGRSSSLSALVAGTDGPSNPAGVLDAGESPLFGAPPANGAVNGTNGTTGSLPSRRPGSSLRPEGPPPSDGPGPFDAAGPDGSAEQDDAERRAGDRRAREVAEQARRDQEAAEQAAQARAARREREEAEAAAGAEAPSIGGEDSAPAAGGTGTSGSGSNGTAPPATDPQGPGTNGGRANGVHPQAFLAPAPFGNRPARGDEPGEDGQTETSADQRSDRNDERQPGESAPERSVTGQRTDQQQHGGVRESDAPGAAAEQEQRDEAVEQAEARPSPRPAPVSPPTTPMPTIRPGGPAPPPMRDPAGAERPAAPRPASQPPAQAGPQPVAPRPAPQPPAQAGPQPVAQAGAPASSAMQPPAPQPPAPQPPAPQPPAPQAPTQQPPSRRPDALFAPSVPEAPEPGRAAAVQAGFERGETTPIFEEIASAWFRSNRPVPVTWETDGDGATPARPATAPGQNRPAAPAAGPAPAQAQAQAQADAPAPQRPPAPAAPPAPTPAPRPVARRAPARPAPAPFEAAPAPFEAAPAAPVSDQAFAGAADEGWRAASGVESDRPDELTAAGLPKRRPRARLVPGSAGSAVLSPPVTASRSAETIRGRLASYQQGVRQGRETRARGGEPGTATDTSTNPASTHDEESS
ncbi:MAG: hypothetical protein QOF00_1274 [Pseudonocardiales bacterium]|nr:hypothetical protein [Pseudonocardiales bacterium]